MARSQFLRGWIQPTMPSTAADPVTSSCARARPRGGSDIASTGERNPEQASAPLERP